MKKILKFQDLIDEKISLSHKVSPVFYYTSKDVKFRAVIRKEVGEKVVKDALLEWLKNGSKDLQGMAKVLQIASKDFGLSTIGENKHQYWRRNNYEYQKKHCCHLWCFHQCFF